MTIEEFRSIDRRGRESDPDLFSLSEPDQRASPEDVRTVEKLIGIQLADKYRHFLLEFGGGTYGLATIFSAMPNSDWYLPENFFKSQGYLPSGLIPFSDDFAGGNYVLKPQKESQLGDHVYYWNQDGGLVETEFSDVLEFIARYAYEPA